jgi:primosomal protein N'
VFARANDVARRLRKCGSGDVLGPAFAPIARVNDEWRVRVALKGNDGAALREAVRSVSGEAAQDAGVRFIINVDP